MQDDAAAVDRDAADLGPVAFEMDEAALQMRAARHPVACTLSFEHTVKNVLTNLIRVDVLRKKNEGENRLKGAHGVSTSYGFVKENNKRGSSHIHCQIKGGATPDLISDVAHDGELIGYLLDALSTQYDSELSLEYLPSSCFGLFFYTSERGGWGVET